MLATLGARLAAVPRRRDAKTTQAVLDDPAQRDPEALSAVLSYRSGERQVWSATELGRPWLTAMRNALDVQIYSFKHPDSMTTSLTRGSALLALLDQPTWDRYGLAAMTGGRAAGNAFLHPRPAGKGDPTPIGDPRGPFSAEDASIPALQSRGAVCHVALWSLAGELVAAGRDPDHAGRAALAADLTNHLVPGVVLVPGAVGTLPEFAVADFHLAA